MNLFSILVMLQPYSPILLPVAVYLVGLLVRHLPSNRLGKLQKFALTAVRSAEQQSNGAFTNEEKYNAAAQGLSLLAARFGYHVNAAEAKLLIEAAVAEFKTPTGVTSVVAPSTQQVNQTQTSDSAAGAV